MATLPILDSTEDDGSIFVCGDEADGVVQFGVLGDSSLMQLMPFGENNSEVLRLSVLEAADREEPKPVV